VLQKSFFSFVKSARHVIRKDDMRERKNATPTNETAKKTRRDSVKLRENSAQKPLRRGGVQKSTPGRREGFIVNAKGSRCCKVRRMLQRTAGDYTE
jgi:hypothetical protein